MTEVREIKGVYEDDLAQLVQDLGLKDDFENGRIRCAFSGEIVTKENFLGIFPDGREIRFVCDNEVARSKLAELSQKRDA